MKLTKGDKVRFLNETGGGTVSRIEGSRLVYVLDEDGFEIPVLISEVVLVKKATEETDVKSGEESAEVEATADGYIYEEAEEDGEVQFLLACTRDKAMSGNVVLYLINDSNYFAFYTIGNKVKDEIDNAYLGTIEPNTKIELDRLAVNLLDSREYEVQLLLFRKTVKYQSQPQLREIIKFSGPKLLKDSSYNKNEYFDDDAILYYLVKSRMVEKLEQLSSGEVKKIIAQKEALQKKPKQKRKDESGILEVDLHINELLDDTRGMSNKEILDYQMEKFHQVMSENKDNKNRKIVFIHGKGNGVLKSEILKSLKRKYKWHSYQDASFKEYGFGATMVVI
ncbi:DUF2027 domain-containing protein [Labilibacter sediminis]|nr:DUF2027 domain-containing protein [Labilibacter sediminis]